jgi:hypothetical protein
MQPPSYKSRKADVGDVIVFTADEQGLSQYPAHVGHSADVLGVTLQTQRRRRSPRAIYNVACGCGVTLNPRSSAFEVKGT